jgi:hypothetical protein
MSHFGDIGSMRPRKAKRDSWLRAKRGSVAEIEERFHSGKKHDGAEYSTARGDAFTGREPTDKNKKGADLAARAFCSLSRVHLQPEHDAQHSADAQHDVCAAFAMFANPNARTAINRATFNVFIVFSF